MSENKTMLEQELGHLEALCEFAYANGFHELGYDPVQNIRAHLTRAPGQVTDEDVERALKVFNTSRNYNGNVAGIAMRAALESLSARLAQPVAGNLADAVTAFQLAEMAFSEKAQASGVLFDPALAVEAGLIAAMPFLSQPHPQAAQGGEAVECGGCAPPIIAMHSAERAAVPEGMVLVPREPTQKMIMAGSASLKCDVDYTRRPQMPTRQRAARNAYVSMLSAAPTLAGKEKG